MSRGPGNIQRRLIAAFAGATGARAHAFSIEELAEAAFPGEDIERKHLVYVRAALKTLPLKLETYQHAENRGREEGERRRPWRLYVRCLG
jgi:hypothetical protein